MTYECDCGMVSDGHEDETNYCPECNTVLTAVDEVQVDTAPECDRCFRPIKPGFGTCRCGPPGEHG